MTIRPIIETCGSYRPATTDDLFVFHPETTVTAPLYDRVSEAANTCGSAINAALLDLKQPDSFDAIQQAARDYYDVIVDVVEECPDREKALEHVLLMKHAALEAAVCGAGQVTFYRTIAAMELDKAQWVANRAIALAWLESDDGGPDVTADEE